MAQSRMISKISAFLKKRNFRKNYKTTTAFIKRRQLGSFFIALGLLFHVILVGHLLNLPKQQEEVKPQPKTVKLYNIGSVPKATFQAKIEKAGVIKIVAQTSGIVQSVSVDDGSKVNKG